jgi:hypothetical protein
MAESSLLLLIIPAAGDNRLIITGKIYEYIASRRTVLCLGPVDGEAAVLLSKLQAGGCFDYNDSKRIEEFIRHEKEQPSSHITDPSEYSRQNLTKKLASIL